MQMSCLNGPGSIAHGRTWPGGIPRATRVANKRFGRVWLRSVRSRGFLRMGKARGTCICRVLGGGALGRRRAHTSLATLSGELAAAAKKSKSSLSQS